MSFYMIQWRYKEAALKAMVQHPQDRSEAARRAIEAYGGKLHHFFFAFGEFDGVAISEFPDAESATAYTRPSTRQPWWHEEREKEPYRQTRTVA